MTSNTLGNAPPDPSTRSPAWLWPFAPMAVAVFSLSALVFYHLRHDAFEVRSALQHVYAAIYRTFGFAPSVMFFGLVALWSTIWLVHGRLERPLQRLGRLAAMAVLLGVLLNLGDGGLAPALHKGGLGAWLAGALVAAIGYWPSLVVVWAFTFASLLLATDFFFHANFERMLAGDSVPQAATATASASPPPSPPLPLPSSPPLPAPAAPAAPLVADETPARRRRSHYERRAERTAAASGYTAAAADEIAVAAPPAAAVAPPAAADDLSAARVVAAIDAAEGAAGAAVAAEETEALDRGGEADPVEGAPPAAMAPAPAQFAGDSVFPGDAAAAPPAVDGGGTSGLAAAMDWSATFDSRAVDAAPPFPAAAAPGEFAVATGDPASGFEQDDFDFAIVDEDGAEADDVAGEGAGASAVAGDTAAVADVAAAPAAPTGDGAADGVSEGAQFTAATDPTDPTDPIVTIPRPDQVVASPGGSLGRPDDALMREAIELVLATRRANAVYLQRKLRVDYDLATAVLHELAARGIVALDAEATHGRILAP
jgi:hypothetical protein